MLGVHSNTAGERGEQELPEMENENHLCNKSLWDGYVQRDIQVNRARKVHVR